jgi:hypothetical protein
MPLLLLFPLFYHDSKRQDSGENSADFGEGISDVALVNSQNKILDIADNPAV